MSPEDERHGTNAGYIAGCREACCKEAHATYRRKHRARTYLARGPLTVDATGSRRRIQALVALGHSMEALDQRLGQSRGYCFRIATHHPVIHRTTALRIARLYDELSMIVPPGAYAQRNRNHALRKGWAVPLAWDDIDDPDERPATDPRPEGGVYAQCDPAVVVRVLAGEKLPTTPAEKREIVRRWPETGHSDRDLYRLTGWEPSKFKDKGAA